MTNATHTPGPWEVSQWSPPYDRIGGDYSVGYMDADGVYWDIATLEPSRASRLTDARLIAAAPDMLWTLEQVDTYLSPMDGEEDVYAEIRGVIQAAIAKAKEEA